VGGETNVLNVGGLSDLIQLAENGSAKKRFGLV